MLRLSEGNEVYCRIQLLSERATKCTVVYKHTPKPNPTPAHCDLSSSSGFCCGHTASPLTLCTCVCQAAAAANVSREILDQSCSLVPFRTKGFKETESRNTGLSHSQLTLCICVCQAMAAAILNRETVDKVLEAESDGKLEVERHKKLHEFRSGIFPRFLPAESDGVTRVQQHMKLREIYSLVCPSDV